MVGFGMNNAKLSGSIRGIWLASCLSYSYIYDMLWLYNHTAMQPANIKLG
jgi:hypothetical protein